MACEEEAALRPEPHGSLELERMKDRSGALPHSHIYALGSEGGLFACHRQVPPDTSGTFARILEFISAHPEGVKRSEVDAAVTLRPSQLGACMKQLVEAGLIKVEGTNRRTRYFPGRPQARGLGPWPETSGPSNLPVRVPPS
jgi:hypothetical protein